MATSRRRSASGRRPSADPAKTFKIVIWKFKATHLERNLLAVETTARQTAMSMPLKEGVPNKARQDRFQI